MFPSPAPKLSWPMISPNFDLLFRTKFFVRYEMNEAILATRPSDEKHGHAYFAS